MAAFIIKNCNLLDVTAGEYKQAISIRVEGERIVEVSEVGAQLTSANTPAINAAGMTLMPGLIDAHVHAAITTMDSVAMVRRQASWRALETKFILEGMLRRGFTTVRDAGGLDLGISNALDRNLIRGPRVFRSGRVISQTGGHGDVNPPEDHPQLCACSVRSSALSHIADGVDAVRRAVREELKSGAHQIKVMAGGGVATPSDSIDMIQYTEDEIRAAVEEARARRTYAFAHAYVPDAIIRAATAGVRSIEHGNLINKDAAELMAKVGCFLVPTLVTYHQLAERGKSLGFPEVSLNKLREVLDHGLGAIDIALQAGVRIGFGTDLLGETHDAQSMEFSLRSAVQTNADIIRSATIVNAELLCRTGQLGVIAPTALADMLVVDGDPLTNIKVLEGQGERLRLIVRGGEIVKNELV